MAHSTSAECSAPGKQQGSCTLGSEPRNLDAAPQQSCCGSAAPSVSELRAKHKRPSREREGLEVQAPAVATPESAVPADLEWAHQAGYYVGELRHHRHEQTLHLPCSPSLCPRLWGAPWKCSRQMQLILQRGSATVPPVVLHDVAQNNKWCGGCAVLTLGVFAGALLFAYACAYHWYVVHDNPLALMEIPLLGLARARQSLQPAHAQVVRICIRCLADQPGPQHIGAEL